VRAIVYDEEEVILAKVPYQNGGFKMTLPATVDASLLYSMSDEEDAPEGIIFSDPNVRACAVDCFGAYKNEEYFDDLIQISVNILTFSMTQSMYMYADRDVTITGTVEDEEEGMTVTYSVNMKKGWNVVYMSMNFMTDTITLTTTPPIVLPEWWFEEDFYNSMGWAPAKAPKIFQINH